MGDVSEDEMKAMNDRMAAVSDTNNLQLYFAWKIFFSDAIENVIIDGYSFRINKWSGYGR